MGDHKNNWSIKLNQKDKKNSFIIQFKNKILS